jgi:hypothetical protein
VKLHRILPCLVSASSYSSSATSCGIGISPVPGAVLGNRLLLAMGLRWIVSAAALPGWLQVFASPHFSRLPSLLYLEDSPRTPMGTAVSRSEVCLSGGVPQTPRAPKKKAKRMFRFARSGCRTLPPRILHLLRCTFPNLLFRRSLRFES